MSDKYFYVMSKEKMKIRILEKERIDEIKPLWEGLNSLHTQLSPHFKQYYQNLSFTKRTEKLIKKKQLKIFVASESDSIIGYCIASAKADFGKINSLFVLPEFRNKAIGHELMETALKWLQKQKCIYVDLIVIEGNEKVIPFYEKYGFKKRVTIMRKA